ncbi:MAG: hypothetical protein AB2A00_35295 [Myxococcota bacterium]
MTRPFSVVMALGCVLMLHGCRVVCVTVLDTCRDAPDGGLTEPRPRDAAILVEDAGADAGFVGCIKEECAQACADVTLPAHVCINPDCLACQDVFCGRLYTCGRDASVPRDAAVPDAARTDAATPDAAVPDAARPDAAVPDATTLDAGPPDAAIPDATPALDATIPDAARTDAALPTDAAAAAG